MTAVTITCTNPLVLSDQYVFEESQRKNLRIEWSVPGGDHEATWKMPCDLIDSIGIPMAGCDVEIRDDATSDVIFQGLLTSPKYRTEKRVIKELDFTAIGYYRTLEFLKQLTHLVYGPATTGSSPLTAKVVVADIKAAIEHILGLSNQGFITIDPALIGASGFPLMQDTQAFAGASAQEILNVLSALTGYLAFPYVWQVRPRSVSGLWTPTFYFQVMESVPTYYDDGESDGTYTYDLTAHPNRSTVEWGTQQKWTEPTDSGGVLQYDAYGGRSIIIDKYVKLNIEFQSLEEIKHLAQAYIQKFKDLTASGETTVISPIRSAGNDITDVHMIRPGHVIRVDKPDDWIYDDEDKYISNVVWSEDSCEATLSTGPIGGLFEDLRGLVAVPNKAITWSMAFGGLSVPGGSVQQALPVIGPTFPEVPGTLEARVHPAAGVSVVLDVDGNPISDKGGRWHPDIVPVRFMGPMQQFKTADGSIIEAATNVARSACLDWKNLNKSQIISKEAATLSVRVNKNGSQVALCSLTASTNSGLVTIGTGPWSTVEGDVITYDIVSNDLSSDFTIMVFGEADHPNYPNFPAPTP